MFTRQVSCATLSLPMFLGLCHVATAKSVSIDAEMPSQQAQEEDDSIPSEQKVRRYVSPLPLEYPVHSSAGGDGFDRMNVADPTVVRHDGQYYLFATEGMAWVSSDLVNWKYHPVTLPDGRNAESVPILVGN